MENFIGLWSRLNGVLLRGILDPRSLEESRLGALTEHVRRLTPNPEQAAEWTTAVLLDGIAHVESLLQIESKAGLLDIDEWLRDRANALAGNCKSPATLPSSANPQIQKAIEQYWEETHEQLTSYVRRKYHRELADAEDIVANDFQRLNEHVKKLESDGATAVWAFLNNRNLVRGWLFTTANILSCCMYREVARMQQTLDTLENLLRDELDRHCSHTFDFEDVEPHLKECSSHEQEVISKLTNDNPSVVAKGYGVSRSTLWRIRNNVRERITASMRQQELFRHID